jgi:hypothetical protein
MPLGDDDALGGGETLGGGAGTEEVVSTCPTRSGFTPIKQAPGRFLMSETTWDNITTFWDVVGGERLTFWDLVYGNYLNPMKQATTTFRRCK